MPECYIRGSTIKYLRIPDEVIDMVKEDILVKSRGRGELKGRGGGGGRGGGRGAPRPNNPQRPHINKNKK
jgi:U6 snRNA-associated Sm-like protein LSm4